MRMPRRDASSAQRITASSKIASISPRSIAPIRLDTSGRPLSYRTFPPQEFISSNVKPAAART